MDTEHPSYCPNCGGNFNSHSRTGGGTTTWQKWCGRCGYETVPVVGPPPPPIIVPPHPLVKEMEGKWIRVDGRWGQLVDGYEIPWQDGAWGIWKVRGEDGLMLASINQFDINVDSEMRDTLRDEPPGPLLAHLQFWGASDLARRVLEGIRAAFFDHLWYPLSYRLGLNRHRRWSKVEKFLGRYIP